MTQFKLTISWPHVYEKVRTNKEKHHTETMEVNEEKKQNVWNFIGDIYILGVKL